MPDPWVAVEATVRRSDKLAALPSDTARWGWLVMLGEAKLLRRQGTFSVGQWAEVMGRYAKYLPDYIRLGLLHRAPAYCDETRQRTCLRGRGPFERGVLVVHDWPRHQREHAVRQADYESRLTDSETDAPTDAVTDVETDNLSRALSSSSVYVNGSSSTGVVKGGDEPEWPALQWLAVHKAHLEPNGKALHRRLIALCEKHGSSTVIRAMAALGEGMTSGQYVLGADNELNPIPQRMNAKERQQSEHDEAMALMKGGSSAARN